MGVVISSVGVALAEIYILPRYLIQINLQQLGKGAGGAAPYHIIACALRKRLWYSFLG